MASIRLQVSAMKSALKFCLFALLLSALPVAVFAGDMQKKDLKITKEVQVNGTSLKPGNYQLKWENSGNGQTQVAFYQNGTQVVTVPAHIVQQQNSNNAQLELDTATSEPTLKHVYTSKEVLEFGAGSQNSSGS